MAIKAENLFKLEKLGAIKSKANTSFADSLAKFGTGVLLDQEAKAETRQQFKETGSKDIRDLRLLRDQAVKDGATNEKSSSGGSIELGDVPSNTTLSNWTLKNIDNFIAQTYKRQEVVTSGLGGKFAVRDYGIYKANQKATWQAIKGRVDNAEAQSVRNKEMNEGYTNDKGVFVPPTSGQGNLAMQSSFAFIQDLNNTNVTPDDEGNGIVEVYQTVFDPTTGLQKRVLDIKTGLPILDEDKSGVSVLALLQNGGEEWNSTNVKTDVDTAFNPTVLDSYETIIGMQGFVGGSREDNVRRNPEFLNYANSFINSKTRTNRDISSTLTDNFIMGTQGFKQLTAQETSTGYISDPANPGKMIKFNPDEKISVNVVTSWDANGKPVYENLKVNKYIGMRMTKPAGILVVDTNDEQRKAATGFFRGVISGKVGRKFTPGQARAQFDPYKNQLDKDKLNKLTDKQLYNIDTMEKISNLIVGGQEVGKAELEALQNQSKYKFSEGVTEVRKLDYRSGAEVVTKFTLGVDKNEGLGSIDMNITTREPNKKFDLDKQLISGDGTAGSPYVLQPEFIIKKEDGKDVKVKNPKYQPQFLKMTKKQLENNLYAVYGEGSSTAARTGLKVRLGDKYSEFDDTTGVDSGGKNIDVTTTKTVGVDAVPSVTPDDILAKGGQTATQMLVDSEAYKSIISNTFNFGIDDEQTIKMTNELGKLYRALGVKQDDGQGEDVEFLADPNGYNISITIPDPADSKKRKTIKTVTLKGNDETFAQNINELFREAVKTGYTAKAETDFLTKTVKNITYTQDDMGLFKDKNGNILEE